ncbi:MAG: tetratricopeptide repeat protein [Pseudanabaena sp.]|nr:MAG: tetratricopeptide repeat protein [Pseudanabaena sp.]
MTNKQTGLEHVNVGGDADINVSQEIYHEPNKLADKIGVVAQAGSTVNIGTFNYNQIIQKAKQAGSLLNLPQTNVTLFAGRDDDLKRVHELLQKNQRVAVSAFVKGMGGVGKSELALQYSLRHLLTDYSGGICWLRGNEGTLTTQLQDFVEVQIGETMPDGLDSGEKLAGHCWRRLSERVEGQMLVVLDDVKDYGDVEPFLPPLNGKFRVLATTRLGFGNAMQQYTLDALVLVAAADLLRSFLPEADPRRGNEEAIENLCTWLGRLPLAIELVGRYLALPNQLDTGISEILQRLQGECMVQLSEITDEERKLLPKNLNVAASFFLSWQELSPLAQRLACLLGLFALAPIPWTLVETSMLTETEKEQFFWQGWKGARGELLNLHLLQRTKQGVYELHQLLREYFQFQLKQHPEWLSLRKQVVVTLLKISRQIPHTPTLKDIAKITPVIPHLEMISREMLDDIPKPEDDLFWVFDGIARFYKGLELFYKGQELYRLAEEPYQRGLTWIIKILGVDNLSVAYILNNLAELYREKAKYSEAKPLFLRSLAIKEQQLGSEHLDVANSLNNLGLLYYLQENYEEAESHYLRSLQIRERQLGENNLYVANSLNNLAELYRVQGKYDKAKPRYLRSLEISEQEIGADHIHVATILNNLGLLYYLQENYGEAESLLLQSLKIRKLQLGLEHPNVADSLFSLAKLYYTQRCPEALQFIQRTIQIYKQKLGTEHPTTQNALRLLQIIRVANKPSFPIEFLLNMKPSTQ